MTQGQAELVRLVDQMAFIRHANDRGHIVTQEMMNKAVDVSCDDSYTFIDVDGGRAVQVPPLCLPVVEKLCSSAVRISPSGYGLYGSELDKGARVAGCILGYPTEKK